MKLNYLKLRRTNIITFLILTISAVGGAFIGGFGLVIAASNLATKYDYAFYLKTGLDMITTASVTASAGVMLTPLWAVFGGLAWAVHANSRGIARNMNVTYFADDHPITRRVHELCTLIAMEPIKWVGYFESDSINAFATGKSPQNAVIAISTGALQKLEIPQVDAVLAHELGHIASADSNRMVYARSVQEALTWFLLWRGFKNTARWLFTPLSEFEIMRLSRSREYRADAVAAILTSKEQIIEALRRVQLDSSCQPPKQHRRFAHLLFRVHAFKWAGTHPDISQRIKAIEEEKYIRRILPVSDRRQHARQTASSTVSDRL